MFKGWGFRGLEKQNPDEGFSFQGPEKLNLPFNSSFRILHCREEREFLLKIRR